MGVGGKMPHARAIGIVEGQEVVPHGHDWPQSRRVTNTAVVSVQVVGRVRVVGMVIRQVLRRAPKPPALAEFVVGGLARMVGVNLVGEGRSQEDRIAGRFAFMRPDVKRDHIFGVLAAQPASVDPTRHVFGDPEDEIILPAAIVEVVVMKMDGGILRGRMDEAHLGAVPIRAGHRPGRQVDQSANHAVWSAIANRHRRDVTTEIPGGEEVLRPVAINQTPNIGGVGARQ